MYINIPWIASVAGFEGHMTEVPVMQTVNPKEMMTSSFCDLTLFQEQVSIVLSSSKNIVQEFAKITSECSFPCLQVSMTVAYAPEVGEEIENYQHTL